MATYTLYAQYVEGELVNVTVTSNNPIVVYSLQAPGVGTLRLRDLRDVEETTPNNGDGLVYDSTSGTWKPGTPGAPNAASVSFTPFSTVTSSTVQDAIQEVWNDIVIESGFENRTDSTLSFTDGTRTFSIAPVGASFSFWVQNEKYTKTTQQDLVISTDEGLHYIYFDETGTLTETLTFTPAIITDYTFCAFVYWDATNSKGILFGDERHGRTMDSSTHAYLHNIFSTQYDSGLALGSILADESGSLDTHIQCAVSNGVIRDEDIRISIENGSPQTLDPVAQIPILYRSGAAGVWRKIDATGYLVTTAGTGRAAWNEWTGATWQLTEVQNNNFVLTHLFATNDINHPIIIIAGQAEYANLSAAQAAALTEIETLASGPLDDAFPEWKAIGTLIVQTSNSYSNAVKSRVRTTAEGDDYIDFRTTNISPSGGTNTGDHGSLTGLADDDHTQYSLADGTRWTASPTNNRLAAADASGNLITSTVQYDAGNSQVYLNGNDLFIDHLEGGGGVQIGTGATTGGNLNYVSADSRFYVQSLNSQLRVSAAQALQLQSTGGTVFSWPSADGSAGAAMVTDGSGALSLQAKAESLLIDQNPAGDGTTDDEAAISAFISAVLSSAHKKGIVGAGEYLTTSVSPASANYSIGGAGAFLSILKRDSDGGNFVNIGENDAITIHDLTLDLDFTTNADNGHGIASLGENITIDSVRVIDFGESSGFLFYPLVPGTQREGIRITNSEAVGNGATTATQFGFNLVDVKAAFQALNIAKDIRAYAHELKNNAQYNVGLGLIAEDSGAAVAFGQDTAGEDGADFNNTVGIVSDSCDYGVLVGEGKYNIFSSVFVDSTSAPGYQTSNPTGARFTAGSDGNVITGLLSYGANMVNPVRFDASDNNYVKIFSHDTATDIVFFTTGAAGNVVEIGHSGARSSIEAAINDTSGSGITGASGNVVFSPSTGEFIGTRSGFFLHKLGDSGASFLASSQNFRFESSQFAVLTLATPGNSGDLAGISYNIAGTSNQGAFHYSKGSSSANDYWQIRAGEVNTWRFYSTTQRPVSDNTIDIGTSSVRVKSTYQYTSDIKSVAQLTPLSAEPTGTAGAVAFSDGTSSTNGFGTSGEGLYVKKASGSWTFLG